MLEPSVYRALIKSLYRRLGSLDSRPFRTFRGISVKSFAVASKTAASRLHKTYSRQLFIQDWSWKWFISRSRRHLFSSRCFLLLVVSVRVSLRILENFPSRISCSCLKANSFTRVYPILSSVTPIWWNETVHSIRGSVEHSASFVLT